MAFLSAGVAPNTARSYASGVRAYRRFALTRGFQSFAAEECHLLNFLSHCATHLSAGTVKVYAQGIRHHQVVHGLPTALFEAARLKLLLQGVARTSTASTRELNRRPVTTDHLQRLSSYLRSSAYSPTDQAMLWSAVTLAFYGFLHVGEYTRPSGDRCLSQDRVTVAADHIVLHLPCSKTEQFGDGKPVVVGATGDATCPVRAISAYLAVNPLVSGPLFRFLNGRPLAPSDVNNLLRVALPGEKILSHSPGC